MTLDSIDGETNFELQPGQFILLKTKEKLSLNGTYCGLFITPSHLAQQGIHVTQGSNFAEPDTDNIITLEVSNNGNEPVMLTEDMKILKVAFTKLEQG